jgi:hypothetical protein
LIKQKMDTGKNKYRITCFRFQHWIWNRKPDERFTSFFEFHSKARDMRLYALFVISLSPFHAWPGLNYPEGQFASPPSAIKLSGISGECVQSFSCRIGY